MSDWTHITVGSVWRSRDKRDYGLTRTVVEAPTSPMGYAVMTSGVRTTRIRPTTLLTRYTLIAPPAESGSDHTEGNEG